MLRVFEASYGSGLGAVIDVSQPAAPRYDGLLFGEFVGSVLLEVAPDCDLARTFGKVPHRVIGEVTDEAKLVLKKGSEILWEDLTSNLAEVWSSTFKEVVK